MQLSFLGKSYTASNPEISTALAGEYATFMGKPYARKQYSVARRQQPKSGLTYRGVDYTA